jgi:hypothetical protein
MAMGSSVSPIISNICMEHFPKLALDLAQCKSLLWPCYIDPERLQNFLSHLNSLRPFIQFAIEFETGSVIPFLDIMAIKKEATLATKAYRKPIHTSRYLIFSSEHLPHVKKNKLQPYSKNDNICLMKSAG